MTFTSSDYDIAAHTELGEDTPPPDPKALKEIAGSYHYSTQIPLTVWLQTASRILKHAKAYAEEDVLDQAFILYMRFIDLFAYNLYKHPDVVRAKADHKAGIQSKEADTYVRYLRLQKKLPRMMNEIEGLNSMLGERRKLYDERQERLRKEKEEKNREKQSRRQRDQKLFDEHQKSANDFLEKHERGDIDESDLMQKLDILSQSTGFGASVKRRPLADFSYPSLPPTYEEAIDKPLPEIPNEPVKTVAPTTTTHKTDSFTEGGSPLRKVFLPSDLIDQFLGIAEKNTLRGLETCGMLCGKLNRNAFFITYLVIPEQDSTPNTCSTKNEEKLFDTIDQLDLFMLGWIHTHPTQSCFLSSVDLHTQNSYQIMLNEAIAVVCAPSRKFNKHLGIFRLTDPPGIGIITNCGRSGFHPHDQDNIYVDCNRVAGEATAGHVIVKRGLPFKVKDLR